MDEFEQGRKNARNQQGNIETAQEQSRQIGKVTVARIFRALEPKMKTLGYAIWMTDNDTFYISRWWRHNFPDRLPDLHVAADYRDPSMLRISASEDAEHYVPFVRKSDQTDEQVMIIVGEYYEATKQSKVEGDNFIKERGKGVNEGSSRKGFWARLIG